MTSVYATLASAASSSSRTPAPHHTNTNTMPGLVSDATRAWEVNVYWPMNAQCAVWDVKGTGVDVWECIRPRKPPSPSPALPN